MRMPIAPCVLLCLCIIFCPAPCGAGREYVSLEIELFIAFMCGASEVYDTSGNLQANIKNSTIYDGYTQKALFVFKDNKMYIADRPGYSVAVIDKNKIYTYAYRSDEYYKDMLQTLVDNKDSYYYIENDFVYSNRVKNTSQNVVAIYAIEDKKLYRTNYDGTGRRLALVMK